MAIKIYPNRIEFERYSLVINETGFVVTSNADPTNTSAYGTFTAADTGIGGLFQGTVAGYVSQGGAPTVISSECIEKFPFSTTFTTASNACCSISKRFKTTGNSSKQHGYMSGGYGLSLPPSSTTCIDKFPFATNSNSTGVGTLVTGRSSGAGISSREFGYTTSGVAAAWPTPLPIVNCIDKFPFVTDVNAIGVGILACTRSASAGHASTICGYISQGSGPPGVLNNVEMFAFASDVGGVSLGTLCCSKTGPAGFSSSTHGYAAGGEASIAPSFRTDVDKFPFSTGFTASLVGTLTQGRSGIAGHSSSTNGFASGGSTPSAVATIDKLAFSNDSSSTSAGSLNIARYYASGHQI